MQRHNGPDHHPPETSRDAAIARALQQVLPGASADAAAASLDATPMCLDAETLAAWQEGALRAEQAATADAHLSTCGRCHTMLAAMVRSEPLATAPDTVFATAPLAASAWEGLTAVASSAWHRWASGWLVPVAAAATAVVIWVALPGRSPSPTASDVLARREPISAPRDGDRPSGPESLAERNVAAPASTPAAAARQAEAPGVNALANRDTRAARGSAGAEADNAELRADAARQAVKARSPAAAPTAPAESARAETPASAFAPQPVGAAMPSPAGRNTGPSAGASVRFADAVDTPAAPTTESAQPSVQSALRAEASATPASAAAMSASRAPGSRARAATAPGQTVEIAAPNAPARWRIRDGRVVEFAPTVGAPWGATTMPAAAPSATPLSTGLTAGHASAATVCWIVGRDGLVLRTTDGRRFLRVSFPETIDLVDVHSIDARTASVTASDGRTFRTADAGATWRRAD